MSDPLPARNHFSDGGGGYARHRPEYPVEVADWLAGQCAATEHALDVGCGTGQLSRLLATRFDRVTATDPSESQIGNAAPHPAVVFKVEPAEQIAMADGTADLVTAAQAAHWFDLNRFYHEAQRVLRPSGVLALVSYGIPVLEDELGELFEAFYWGDFHAHWPAGREHVEQGYKSLDFPFAELQAPPVAIRRDWSLDDMLGYVETWSATRRARKAGEGQKVDAFSEALSANWPDAPSRVTWPITIRATRF